MKALNAVIKNKFVQLIFCVCLLEFLLAFLLINDVIDMFAAKALYQHKYYKTYNIAVNFHRVVIMFGLALYFFCRKANKAINKPAFKSKIISIGLGLVIAGMAIFPAWWTKIFRYAAKSIAKFLYPITGSTATCFSVWSARILDFLGMDNVIPPSICIEILFYSLFYVFCCYSLITLIYKNA